MEAVTIKDIARALNLSTSTVSRALRDSYEISPETKRLVMDYAERINYQPNPIALSLKENRSRVLGVIVPQIANNFFSQAINGIEAVAYERGYHVIIMQTHESLEREILTVQQAVARRVDGLLISISSQTTNVAHLQAIQQRNVPIVMFDRVSAEMDTPKIVADNFGGSFAATEHLIQTGRRRIAFVAIPPFMAITQDRLAGYQAALSQYGLPYDEDLVRFVGFGEHELAPIIDQLLDLPHPPDAFFMAFDRLALGCMTALRNRNVAIPEQVSLIGFTNISVADLLDPPMSTVVQPAQEIGHTAAERLIELIELKQKPSAPLPTRPNPVSIPNQLFIRESTRRGV
ncbi:LacI family DNA-binding transcriptional regulator [Fibrella sp. HMF5335]|uniref:LacI family DNA-binding transcriptional regulator n=1 Tax=Fibrella rubiginis TaxID=2817060 RepID=A0A939K773_9BACT|nr:LacI family DNA-binding transcriptional regulator [Fibrella rubiginis]MBO0938320.1 LacI family DNA-binding transcriptional regulator [Fibrella rubiginis]